jgi:FixJ family two-component response regulator
MPPNRQKIVAIIDDDPGMRASISTLLSAFGYDTETFDSAEAFLNIVATSEATCLVVDIQLGGMNGVELGRQLAAAGFTFPIVFMTGRDNDRLRCQATQLGYVAYLNKPFAAELLIDGIKGAMG